jgi:membrane-bound serine protease (ClpP class)
VKRALAACSLVLSALVVWSAAPAWPSTPSVDVVKVQGVIDPALSSFVQGSIESAEREGATVVLQIDSRGALGDHAEALTRIVRGATVPVVAWVGPTGARAEGGALLLVYSAGVVGMAPGAGLGPARPFDLATKASREPAGEVSRGAATLRSLAAGAGVDPGATDRLVGGAALAAGPAQRAGAVGFVAVSIPELLRKVDGLQVATGAGAATLATLNREDRPVVVRFREIGFVDRVLHGVSTPTAVYVLLLIGLWGIAFELTQPALGMAGIGGILALALCGYGLTVVPVHWLGLGLLLAGVTLQALDVVVKRVGVLTFAGTAAFLAGSLLAWSGVAAAIDLSLWLVILATVAGFLLFGFGLTVALKARERVRSAQVGLVGLRGEARSDLNPEGGVFVKGTLWRARSMDGPIRSGAQVRVRGIDGLILQVEEDPEA